MPSCPPLGGDGVFDTAEVATDGWDMHNNLQGEMEDLSPSFSQAYAALIRDLDERACWKAPSLFWLRSSVANHSTVETAAGTIRSAFVRCSQGEGSSVASCMVRVTRRVLTPTTR